MKITPGILITYGLLAIAIMSTWLRPIKVKGGREVPAWTVLLLLACVSGIVFGLLTPAAVPALLAFSILTYFARGFRPGIIKVLLLLATAIMALALSFHLFPGFINPSITYSTRINGSPSVATYNFHFDKIAAGLVLLAAFCAPSRSRYEWRSILRQYPVILGTPIVVLTLGMVFGYVFFDPKFYSYTPLLVLSNLIFTCVPEEAFFRGFAQQQLAIGMKRVPYGAYIAMLVVPILFGLAHAKGGALLVALAAVAGFGYGYAYFRSQRIEAAILTHIALNALNFMAFSFPQTH